MPWRDEVRKRRCVGVPAAWAGIDGVGRCEGRSRKASPGPRCRRTGGASVPERLSALRLVATAQRRQRTTPLYQVQASRRRSRNAAALGAPQCRSAAEHCGSSPPHDDATARRHCIKSRLQGAGAEIPQGTAALRLLCDAAGHCGAPTPLRCRRALRRSGVFAALRLAFRLGWDTARNRYGGRDLTTAARAGSIPV
jgi:hypothetical protein